MEKQLKTYYESPKANITYFALEGVLTDTSVPGKDPGFELPDDEFSLRKPSEEVYSWVNNDEE